MRSRAILPVPPVEANIGRRVGSAASTLGPDQATPGEMAEALTMTRGAISKIVDKLQSKGWIRSRSSPRTIGSNYSR